MDTERTRQTDMDEAERTYRFLRRKIVDGKIPPGSPLVESGLSDRLNVSRTPIRTALIRLRRSARSGRLPL